MILTNHVAISAKIPPTETNVLGSPKKPVLKVAMNIKDRAVVPPKKLASLSAKSRIMLVPVKPIQCPKRALLKTSIRPRNVLGTAARGPEIIVIVHRIPIRNILRE